jgi:hypothetical protein
MKSQITNSHLKTHGMTTNDYKAIYGPDSLSSPEYKAKLTKNRTGKNNPNYGNKWSSSAKKSLGNQLKGKTPWNKGKKLEGEHLLTVQESVKQREEKYKQGILTRNIHNCSDETKLKISQGVKAYAEKNKEELRHRAKKSLETKRELGYDLAFFRGKTHTPETKQKMKNALINANQNKIEKSNQIISANAKLCKISILNDPGSKLLKLKCDECSSCFTFTRQYFTASKLNEKICPTCYPRIYHRSKKEIELYEFVRFICPDAISNNRSILGNSEIDIFVPSKNIAIEFNGLYWHSEQILTQSGYSKTKDNEKRKACNNLNIRYIAVMEDEWDYKKDLVKSRLSNILNNSSRRIFARNCEVKELSSRVASNFCEANHIQGKGRSNVRLGLFHNDELVSVMTFSKNNVSRKIKEWELNRFCSLSNCVVVGGASKLFKKFIELTDPQTVITYADLRWSEGKIYNTLGFEFEKETVSNYWYFTGNDNMRIHRYSLRKTSNDDPNKTEKQLRDEQGYLRVWDCGSSKWIWKRPE